MAAATGTTTRCHTVSVPRQNVQTESSRACGRSLLTATVSRWRPWSRSCRRPVETGTRARNLCWWNAGSRVMASSAPNCRSAQSQVRALRGLFASDGRERKVRVATSQHRTNSCSSQYPFPPVVWPRSNTESTVMNGLNSHRTLLGAGWRRSETGCGGFGFRSTSGGCSTSGKGACCRRRRLPRRPLVRGAENRRCTVSALAHRLRPPAPCLCRTSKSPARNSTQHKKTVPS